MSSGERKFLFYQLWLFAAASVFFLLGYLSGLPIFFTILSVLIVANIVIGLPFCIRLHMKMLRKVKERTGKNAR